MSIIIKMASIGTESHVSNAIHYIMQPKKAEGRTYSNAGIHPEEIVNTFLLTQKHFDRPGKRKGYHYKFSFSKEETISHDDALSFIKEWANEYLGEQYDYVVAAHNDRDHMHMHLVFNSVSREGKKYRYEKGDWEKVIKPLTNRLCKKYGTECLREKEGAIVTKDWNTMIRRDMDRVVSESSSYEEFIKKMEALGYQIREGVSQKHGAYLALKAPGKDKAVRSYQLGSGYMPAELFRRIEKKPVVPIGEIDGDECYRKIYQEKTSIVFLRIRQQPFIPYKNLSVYQQHFVRKMLEARKLYRGYHSSMQVRDQSSVSLKRFEEIASTVCRFGIKTPQEAEQFRQNVYKHMKQKTDEEKPGRKEKTSERKELKRLEKNIRKAQKENVIVKKKTR